ncbi:MAG: biotin transporter BioY [Massiliimalia sp.]|jgi:biotin transport system substrate-specific component
MLQQDNHFSTADLTRMAICIALLCVSAWISFPLPLTPAPVTAQTLMINLIGFLMLPKRAFATVGIYLFMGAIGLPILSGGAGGPAKLFGPTGGFLLGFLLAVPLISFVNQKLRRWISNDFTRFLIVSIGVSIPVIDLFGGLYMAVTNQMNFTAVIMAAAVPFLFGDILKCVAASFVAVALQKVMRRQVC